MELSIFVAKIFALYMFAVGVGVFSGKLNVSKMVADLEKSQGLSLIAGFVTLVLGALLVQYHNLWSGAWWVILITILSWGVLLKGFLLIAYPQAIFSFKGLYKNMKPSWGIPFMVLGLLLGYFLFF